MPSKTMLVTGAAGFIGSCFVRARLAAADRIVSLDNLSYAGHLVNLTDLPNVENHTFIQGDIRDTALVSKLLAQYQPDAVVNFAAQTHVDRSIFDPEAFVQTNVLGCERLLHSALDYWKKLSVHKQESFRFLQISTDEVFGALGPDDAASPENGRYAPRSPYSASKAAADHFVDAYHATYGLPTLITHSPNNYGPRQHPEKLIALMVLNAVDGKKLPIYGNGQNIRQWLHVQDHCEALGCILEKGLPGLHYNISGGLELANLEMVGQICRILDELSPRGDGRPHAEAIEFVADRPGHDYRYSLAAGRLQSELGWRPKRAFEDGLRQTVKWYLNNPAWIKLVKGRDHERWIEKNYSSRTRLSEQGLCS